MVFSACFIELARVNRVLKTKNWDLKIVSILVKKRPKIGVFTLVNFLTVFRGSKNGLFMRFFAFSNLRVGQGKPPLFTHEKKNIIYIKSFLP